jgi:hypothetical protein
MLGGLPTSIEGLCLGSLLPPITSGSPKLLPVAAHGQVNTPPVKFLPVDGSISDVSREGLFVKVGCPASIPGLELRDSVRVFLAIVSASSPCSQGPNLVALGSNKAYGLSLRVYNTDDIAMENGLTKPQKLLFEWMREKVKHNEVHLAFLKDMEEKTRRANKVAIPPAAVEGSALMQEVMRDLKANSS